MISVENFYWYIWQNLLESTGFCSAYYYPFGTRNQVVKEVFGNTPHTAHGHVLHFDQEPIYASDLDHLFQASNFNRIKYPSVLANSEHSLIKTEFCKQHDLLDWYYFFHGFAALDWYSDAAYITAQQPIINHFLCLNHLVTDKRVHRMAIMARLVEHGLLGQGTVSFCGSHADCDQELGKRDSLLSSADKQRIDKYLASTQLPIFADCEFVDGSFSANFGVHEYHLRQKSFIHVVTESVFFDEKLHLTEKVFQPIVTLRPFLLVGAPNNLEYLRSYGFKTFSNWIDESYDRETDQGKRLDMIVAELIKLCGLPLSTLREMLHDMMPTLSFNRQHFFSTFKYKLVGEMIDNFDHCIKIWNNGRVRYQWPRHQDLLAVKKRMLGIINPT